MRKIRKTLNRLWASLPTYWSDLFLLPSATYPPHFCVHSVCPTPPLTPCQWLVPLSGLDSSIPLSQLKSNRLLIVSSTYLQISLFRHIIWLPQDFAHDRHITCVFIRTDVTSGWPRHGRYCVGSTETCSLRMVHQAEETSILRKGILILERETTSVFCSTHVFNEVLFNSAHNGISHLNNSPLQTTKVKCRSLPHALYKYTLSGPLLATCYCQHLRRWKTVLG
jgi:hypothetical protein